MSRKFAISKDEKSMLNKIFWRTNCIFSSFNFVKMMGVGYAYSMMPAINMFCKTPEEKKAALKRHVAFYNTTPYIITFPLGLSAAMEKERSEKPEKFDASSINAVKAGLMGPLAGIGDSIFWGTLRVIAAGIGIALAQQGNILGPILFLLIFNLPHYIGKYYLNYLGYTLGGKYISNAYENGSIKVITDAASILGLMMVGAMVASMVAFSTTVKFNMSGMNFILQDVLDKIFKGILPLSLTMGCFALLRKGVKTNWLLVGLLALSFVLKLIQFA
jgi:mannose/fructose/N-acetylgalactosamine-specific phosphotransferase system component IID